MNMHPYKGVVLLILKYSDFVQEILLLFTYNSSKNLHKYLL